MEFLKQLPPWLLGLLIGIGAGIILGLLLQSAVMGFTLGAGIAILLRNVFRETRRRKF